LLSVYYLLHCKWGTSSVASHIAFPAQQDYGFILEGELEATCSVLLSLLDLPDSLSNGVAFAFADDIEVFLNTGDTDVFVDCSANRLELHHHKLRIVDSKHPSVMPDPSNHRRDYAEIEALG
jgi:hypothetical protein